MFVKLSHELLFLIAEKPAFELQNKNALWRKTCILSAKINKKMQARLQFFLQIADSPTFLLVRAHLHMAKNLLMNIRQIFDEEFFSSKIFFWNIKFAKANQQV